MRALPISARPLITAYRHPHVVDRLALLWGDRDAVAEYLESLMISSRPQRRGFAVAVLSELIDLQRWLLEAPGR